MDYILCVLLMPAIVLGATDSELTCEDNYCNNTDTDYINKIVLSLDTCRNLTVLKLTPNLESLELRNCNSNELNIDDIGGLANLSYLGVYSGDFVQLSDEQFAKLPGLSSLIVAESGIERISADAFKGLSELWLLSLDFNSISSLPDNVFHPLPRLKYLYLGLNKLVTLPESLFTQSPTLEGLYLEGNPLTMISPETLEPLSELEYLDLNNCSSLHELLVHSTEYLVLNNSGVKRLDILGTVKKVQAANNQITILNIHNKIPVTELDLHGNKLESYLLPGILVGMWRLQHLDLSMNQIGDLPTFKSSNSGEPFILPNLRFVNLSGNRLEHLRVDSPMLSPSLTHLDLSYNMIQVIEPHVFGLVNNLQILHIEGNLIRHFKYERFFAEQRGLKELALYGNEFSKESYYNITKYFTDAGVIVIEKNLFGSVKTFEREASEDWSSWDILLRMCLLVALAFNLILLLRLQRARGENFCSQRRSSRMKARFVSIDGSDN